MRHQKNNVFMSCWCRTVLQYCCIPNYNEFTDSYTVLLKHTKSLKSKGNVFTVVTVIKHITIKEIILKHLRVMDIFSVRTKDFNVGLAEWENGNVFERSTHNIFLVMLEFPHFGSKTFPK